jgi:phosphatidate cytidylyltransferase
VSELTKRILFAVPAVIITVGLTWLGGPYFYAALIVLVLLIQMEIQTIAGRAGFKSAPFFSYIVALWIMLIPILPYPFEIGIALFLLFAALQVFNTRKTHIEEFVVTTFCAGYASFGLLFLLFIRNTGSNHIGFLMMLTLFLMIWGNDIFAYFGGKYFGKRQLAPAISPGKTLEGALFGFLGSIIGLIIAVFATSYLLNFTWLLLLPAALLVSIFSPIGDLAESKLKRAAGIKDVSNILPGHGGFLDRFDGMILAAPAFYLYIHCLNLSGYVFI